MLEPENELWDLYKEKCDRHESLLALQINGRPVDREEIYKAHLDAYNTLTLIISGPAEQKMHPDDDRILSYIRDNIMCTVQEMIEAVEMTSEAVRASLTSLGESIGFDSIDGVVRLWERRAGCRGGSTMTDEQLDSLVRSYMSKMGKITVDECCRHIGVTVGRLRSSLRRIGYPTARQWTANGDTTLCYYPHGSALPEFTSRRKQSGRTGDWRKK